MAEFTNDMMRVVARKTADDYCEQLFWDHLPIIAEYVAEREGVDLKKDAGSTAPVAEHGGD